MKIYTCTLAEPEGTIGLGFQVDSNQRELLTKIAERLKVSEKLISHNKTTTLHICMDDLKKYLANLETVSDEDKLIFQAYNILHTRISPNEPKPSFAFANQNNRRSPPRSIILSTSKKNFFADPAIRSVKEDSDTLKLAREQTIAARACLYWPSEKLSTELSKAARGILKFVNFLENKDPALILGLCARLLGPEGLCPDARFIEGISNHAIFEQWPTPGDKTEIQARRELANYCKAILRDILLPVSNIDSEDKPELGSRRAMTIGLLGDIGAFMTPRGATQGTERLPWVSQELQNAFGDFALSLEGKKGGSFAARQPVRDSVAAYIKLGGGPTVGPQKPIQRIRVEEVMWPRTGIHDTGLEADEKLGRLGKSGTLPGSTWSTARLHTQRIGNTEPMSGHMSASPSEILWPWDVLAGRGLANAYVGSAAYDKDPESMNPYSGARCAGACAFLIGCGYHTSLEVVHGALTYQGQQPGSDLFKQASEVKKKLRKELTQNSSQKERVKEDDAGTMFYENAATKLIVEMVEDAISPTGIDARQQKIPEPQNGFMKS